MCSLTPNSIMFMLSFMALVVHLLYGFPFISTWTHYFEAMYSDNNQIISKYFIRNDLHSNLILYRD
jgi:hypothetical protein